MSLAVLERREDDQPLPPEAPRVPGDDRAPRRAHAPSLRGRRTSAPDRLPRRGRTCGTAVSAPRRSPASARSTGPARARRRAGADPCPAVFEAERSVPPASLGPPRPAAARPAARGAKIDSAGALGIAENARALADDPRRGQEPGGAGTRTGAALPRHSRAPLRVCSTRSRRPAARAPRIRSGSRTSPARTIDWLRRQNRRRKRLARALVPRLMLRAQAHLLLAIASLWTKEFSRARAHLVVAYRSFARAAPRKTSLAIVEIVESQRRSLTGEGATALVLARRARETFEAHAMEDYAARARVAEGLAHAMLGEHEAGARGLPGGPPGLRAPRALEQLRRRAQQRGDLLTSSADSKRRAASTPAPSADFARAAPLLARLPAHRIRRGPVRGRTLRRGGGRGLPRGGASSGTPACAPISSSRMLLEVESWARHGEARARPRAARGLLDGDRTGRRPRPAVQRKSSPPRSRAPTRTTRPFPPCGRRSAGSSPATTEPTGPDRFPPRVRGVPIGHLLRHFIGESQADRSAPTPASTPAQSRAGKEDRVLELNGPIPI